MTKTLLTKKYELIETDLLEFHRLYPNGSIDTTFTISGKLHYFAAKIILDTNKPARYFTGFAFESATKDTVLEEIEIGAISRALANA